jgi:hypothetical protein
MFLVVILANKLPSATASVIRDTEQNLAEFYEHLETMLDRAKI